MTKLMASILILSLLLVIFISCTDAVDVKAFISYNAVTETLTVTNGEQVAWLGASITINNDYILTHEERLAYYSTYTFRITDFAKEDGTRFNPDILKVVKVSISCELADGRRGQCSDIDF